MPSTNITGTAVTAVYIPPTSGNPHCILQNLGGYTAYVGQFPVTTANGLPLPPNTKSKVLFAGGTIYATAGFLQEAPYGTASSVTSYPAGSTITVASGGTAFTAGMAIVVEPGTPRQEIAFVASSNAGSVMTTAPFTFAHGTTTTFSQITPYATTVKADRGTA